MDAKAAIRKAKDHVTDLFGEEQVAEVLLEEIERDPNTNEWVVTVGFTRKNNPVATTIRGVVLDAQRARELKTVRIDDTTGDIVSLTMWKAA